MNREKIKEILDKTNISVIDEINILDYIDVLDNRIDKAIEYIGLDKEDINLYDIYDVNGIELLKILKGEDNE